MQTYSLIYAKYISQRITVMSTFASTIVLKFKENGKILANMFGTSPHSFFHFILIYLCRVEYTAKEADFCTSLPKQKLNILITVI